MTKIIFQKTNSLFICNITTIVFVMNAIEFQSVADIVINNIKTATIFKKNGIDYTIDGHLCLAEACKNKNIDYYYLVSELIKVEKNNSYLKDYNAWQLDFLADYLINIHHEYVEENIPFIKKLLLDVVKQYGEKHAYFTEIYALLFKVSEDLTHHIKEEEKVLFPYIKELLQAKRKQHKFDFNNATCLAYSLDRLKEKQNITLLVFKQIRHLTKNYTIPVIEDKQVKILYYKLEKFEEDLIKHLHLETNILYPKARKLENIVKHIS